MLRNALQKDYTPSFAELNHARKEHITVTSNVATEGVLDSVSEGFQNTISGIKNRWKMAFATQEKILQRMAELEMRMRGKTKVKDGASNLPMGRNFIQHLCVDGMLMCDAESINRELVRIEEVCGLYETAHTPALLKLLKYVTDDFMREAIVDHENVMITHVPESKDFYPKQFDHILTTARKDVTGLTKKNGLDVKCSTAYMGEWFIASAIGNYNTCHSILPSLIIGDSKHIDVTGGKLDIEPFTVEQVELLMATMHRVIKIVQQIKKHTNFSAELDRLFQMADRYERAFKETYEYTTKDRNGQAQRHEYELWENEAAKPYMVAMAAVDETEVYEHLDAFIVGVHATIMHMCEASVRVME